MTIVPLRKVSLLGMLEDKEAVLDAAQAFGGLHLIPMRNAQKELEAVPSGTGREAMNALRWLMDCPAPRRVITRDEGFDVQAVITAADENRRALRQAEDEKAALLKRIADVGRWGEFAFPDVEELGGYRLWFYEVPLGQEKRLKPAGLTVETVYRDRRTAFMVVLSPDEPPASAMPVPRVHIGAHALSALETRLEAVEVRLDDLWMQRRDLSKWRMLLAGNLARARDSAARRRAALETAEVGRIFVMQAWARADQVEDIERLAARLGIAAHVEKPGEEDSPPTLLENAPGLAAGEDLVEFYQTPGYRGWDPSAIVYVSFIVFFGMIMTDAGYGLLLLALLFAFRGRFSGSPTSRRMLVMGYWLALSTTVFGVLTGSYFGVEPKADTVFARLDLVDLANVDAMMKVTVGIGVLHLVTANLVSAWHGRGTVGRLPPLGWCLVALGGLVAYLAGGTGVIADLGIAGIALGLGVVAVFASDRPVSSLRGLGARVAAGLMGLARVVNIFSDVLSYMRLFALGLAAASLAATINAQAGQLVHAVPGVGVLLALVVLVAGHAINMGLGLIAGTVHGLRLNVIEFFNWGMSEEGRPFRPFRKEETRL